MTTETPLAIGVGRAAKIIGVSHGTMRRWADDGLLDYYRTPGGQRRFAMTDIQRFLDDRKALRRVALKRELAKEPKQRWTIYVAGHMIDGLEVMPVSEHERLETTQDKPLHRGQRDIHEREQARAAFYDSGNPNRDTTLDAALRRVVDWARSTR